jgi:hypothetical protein
MRIYTLRKTTTLAVLLALALVVLLGALTLLSEQSASAANDPIVDPGQDSGDGVTPDLVQGNPSCNDLGYSRGVKVDPPNAGTYASGDGYLSVTVSNIHTITDVGQVFDWTSTRGVDKVIVKGGDAADAYVYTPEDDADTSLHAPVNPNTGEYFDLSHMDFCYDVEAQVSKTADTSFTRTYKWKIDKSADPDTLNLATGGTGSSHYTIVVDKNGYQDSAWAVSGKITATNPLNNQSITINSINDVLSPSNTAASVTDCTSGGNDITLPHTLAPDASLECSYSASLSSGTNGTNTATAVSGTNGIGNGVGKANFTFGDPTTEVNKSVEVDDSYSGGPQDQSVSLSDAPKTFEYDRTIGPYNTCGDQTVENTATLFGDNNANLGSDSASVTAHVQCKLTVVKKLDPATDTGKFNLLIDNVVKASNVGNNGTTGAQQVSLGSHTVSETAGTGTTLSNYVSKINCGGADVSGTSTTVSFASGDSDKTCTITNTKKGQVTVKKTTDGVVNPTKSIDFRLTGPGLPSGGVTLNVNGDQDGVLDFGYALTPGSQYTICENPVPAGFTSFWKLDNVIVTPYNPNATDSPPQDLGVRCYNFSASAGQTRAFNVDNSHPGGEPRTIGYWKNWNKCSGGNQAATAAKNGGAAAGVFIVEDLLPQTIGNLNVSTCAQAVKVLSKQDQSGKNMASDAAYELAAQLLAARFNLAAGAETCTAVQNAVVSGQNLLVSISFNGSGSYLTKSSTNKTSALNLAATLDKYNNGNIC